MKNWSPVLVLVLLLVGGCSTDGEGSARFDEVAWKSELLQHRDQKDEEFRTSSTSPMAGAQYLKSKVADRIWLMRQGRTFELAYEATPGASLLLERSDGAWHWTAREEGAACLAKGDDVDDGNALEGPAECLVNGMQISLYPSEERVTFIVFDAERPEMIEPDQLLYFPPDSNYAVDAQLVRFDRPDEVEMLTSRNLVKTFYRYAGIHFRLDGKELELTAFKSVLSGEGSTALFIPFRDGTSGHATYAAGRFLEIDEPDGEHFVLDFNRGFNPLCNYSPAYNCTIPPRENHLDVAIPAGEKTYPHE